MTKQQTDWDAHLALLSGDPLGQLDALRARCPVAYDEQFGWALLRHRDVMSALHDPATFSNAVSQHLSVPNGMDSPQHTAYRRIVDRYFTAPAMAKFAPACRSIARELIAQLPADRDVDVMAHLAEEFALQAQCAFLGWSVELHRELRAWTRKNQAATRARDRTAMAAVAFEFDQHIRGVLADRREHAHPADDVTTQLLTERVQDRLLSDEEIVSILRNWTVGELATISACVGILVHFLATQSDVQQVLRADESLIPAAIDEILRIESPLFSSRRITTCPVTIGDRTFSAAERVTLMWAAANRDEQAFAEPNTFRLDRDPAQNLLYGAGIHVCPGAPLARLELQIFIRELLRSFELHATVGEVATRAAHPAAGFDTCVVRLKQLS